MVILPFYSLWQLFWYRCQSQVPEPVLVTEPGTGSGAKFSSYLKACVLFKSMGPI